MHCISVCLLSLQSGTSKHFHVLLFCGATKFADSLFYTLCTCFLIYAQTATRVSFASNAAGSPDERGCCTSRDSCKLLFLSKFDLRELGLNCFFSCPWSWMMKTETAMGQRGEFFCMEPGLNSRGLQAQCSPSYLPATSIRNAGGTQTPRQVIPEPYLEPQLQNPRTLS